MFRNYLAAALRNLVRNQLYAAINIVGLAVGFAAALLVALFVHDEFSYEGWIPNHDRLVIVSTKSVFSNFTDNLEMAPSFVAGMLKQEFPAIEATARLAGSSLNVRNGDVEYREQIYWADSSLFDVLKLPVSSGDPMTALKDPDSIVVTRGVAFKYFGTDAVVGKALEFDRKVNMRITAVLQDLPSNTHLDLGIIASGATTSSPLTTEDTHPRPFTYLPEIFYTYARLKDAAAIKDLQRSLPDFVNRHPEFRREGATLSLDVEPIASVHLRPERLFEMKDRGNANAAYGLLLVGALIVIVAAINFMSLTSALATQRQIEVGVRKISGAERFHLFAQFICESGCHVLIATAIGILIADFLLPSFNGFLGRTISLSLHGLWLFSAAATVILAVALAGAAWPALMLTRSAPARLLKSGCLGSIKGSARRFFVTLQFAVLTGLGLVAVVIYLQLRYATHEGLRFDANQVLEVTVPCTSSFVSEVPRLPGVIATACSTAPVEQDRWGPPLQAIGPDGRLLNPSSAAVDFGYLELLGVNPLAGRFFSRDFGSDAAAGQDVPLNIVINESLALALGFANPQQALGQVIRWQMRVSGNDMKYTDARSSEIIGVAPDFVRGSIREVIPPTVFMVGDPASQFVLSVKLDGRRLPETLAAMDRLWKRIGPPRPISRTFVDQAVQRLYLALTREVQFYGGLAAVAVFVAALGLFGLSAFTAARRTKEIGIRKAMGAARSDILGLVLWDFAKPVLGANLIAWPVGYYVMRRWLQGFAYHVDLEAWIFIAASTAALAIAILTVIGHALLIVRTQPVAALRYE